MQIHMKAFATEMKAKHFGAGPSWCLRFMKKKDCPSGHGQLCQQLSPKEKINFSDFTQRKIEEYSIGSDEIMNMDEVHLMFDLPLTRTVNKKGESTFMVRTTGHERMNFICVRAAQHQDYRCH